jgi:general nucleoside transport system permease protein
MIRISKQTELSRVQTTLIRIAAVLFALLTSAIFIIFIGKNPFQVYFGMLQGAFGTGYRFKETIIKTIPFAVTSLGILVAFKMKFWNIGAEGQILMGAFLASFIALNFPGTPKPILLLLMFIAGFIGGGVWALIPAFLKSRFGTNETLVTLMMNYIALKWITYLQYVLWKDPAASGMPKIAPFGENAILPKLFGVHIGWIIVLILAFFITVFIRRTKKGYEISVIGESENTARYAGMNIKKIIIIAVMISGGLCGITGMMQVSGVVHTLTDQITGGVGYTAIITTWLSGLSAPAIVAVSFLFAILVQGGSYIQTAFQIPQAAAQILQGMILFFVLGSEFFIQYKIILPKRFNQGTIERKGVN